MARGRKAATAVIETPPEPNPEVLDADLKALDAVVVAGQQQDAAVRAVALQLGYQLPADCTDPDLIQRDISANMRRSVEACLEVGRGLRVLKEACAHGEFVARLEVLGIDKHVASRFMQSAAKFSKLPSTATLKAIGNQTKLFEMLVLDDEQIEELELTGQTGELALDDVATMSVKELRAACRELREQKKAQERLLADKNARLDELITATAVIDPWDEKVGRFKAEIASGFDLLDDAVGKLYLMHSVILQDDVQWGGGEEAERVILRQFATLYGDRLERLGQQLAELQDHYEATLGGWRGELDGRVLRREDGARAEG